MRIVKLKVVEKPKAFTDVRFTVEEFEAAMAREKRFGPVECTLSTAMENVRNAKGLYRIDYEKPEVNVNHTVGGLNVAEMDKTQLILAATQIGMTIKKGTTMRMLREGVTAKLAQLAETIEDDDQEVEA